MKQLVILDRDGVVNEDSDEYIKSLDEWLPVPGSLEAIGQLCQHGFTVAVATNQSGISRGYYTHNTLYAMHKRLNRLLVKHGGVIDRLFYCPHGPDDNCDCRKPKNGLFRKIENQYNISLTGVPAVGDSFRDIVPAVSRGAEGILVKTGKGKTTLEKHKRELGRVAVFDDLQQAAQYILKKYKSQ